MKNLALPYGQLEGAVHAYGVLEEPAILESIIRLRKSGFNYLCPALEHER